MQPELESVTLDPWGVIIVDEYFLSAVAVFRGSRLWFRSRVVLGWGIGLSFLVAFSSSVVHNFHAFLEHLFSLKLLFSFACVLL